MADYTIDDVVDFAITGDTVNLEAAINDVMADKINKSIEMKKFEVINRLFNKEPATEEEVDD